MKKASLLKDKHAKLQI